MALRYDTASGQWIDSEAEEKVTETAAQQTVEEKAAYNPIPEEPQKKSRKPLFIGIGVVAVLCVVFGVIVAVRSFGNPSQEILLALQNTFKDETHTGKFLQQLRELTKEEYTISMAGSMDDKIFSLEYHNNAKEPQLKGSYEDYWIEEIKLLASITEDRVKVQFSDFGDYVFTYNYKEKKTGYLFEQAQEEEIEALDFVCEYLYDMNSQKSMDDEIYAILLEEYNSWKFQKAEARTFRVNGERIKCEGYKTVVSSDQLISVLELIEDLYVEYGLDYWKKMPDDIEDPFETLYSELDEMLDMEITFYLTDEQVACILMETEDEEIKISFKGNKNGAQDIEIVADNYSILEIEHETAKTEEKTKVSLYGAQLLVFTYDYDSNDVALELDYDYSTFRLAGRVEIQEEEIKYSLDSLYFIYTTIDDLECEVTIKKGANVEEIEGEEFDLGTATEDEFYDVLGEIYSSLPEEDFGDYLYDDYEYYDEDYELTPQELYEFYEEYFYGSDISPEEFLEMFPEYDISPEEFLELFPQNGTEEITGGMDL